MLCETVAGWQTLIGQAFRTVDGGGAFVVEEREPGAAVDCDLPLPSVFTLLGTAVVDGVIGVEVADGSVDALGCDTVLGDATALQSVFAGGVLRLFMVDEPVAETCNNLSVADKLRQALVMVDGQWRLRAISVEDAAAVECDNLGLTGVHSQLANALVPVDGGYALRVSGLSSYVECGDGPTLTVLQGGDDCGSGTYSVEITVASTAEFNVATYEYHYRYFDNGVWSPWYNDGGVEGASFTHNENDSTFAHAPFGAGMEIRIRSGECEHVENITSQLDVTGSSCL